MRLPTGKVIALALVTISIVLGLGGTFGAWGMEKPTQVAHKRTEVGLMR